MEKDQAGFVGRRAELAALDEALGRATRFNAPQTVTDRRRRWAREEPARRRVGGGAPGPGSANRARGRRAGGGGRHGAPGRADRAPAAGSVRPVGADAGRGLASVSGPAAGGVRRSADLRAVDAARPISWASISRRARSAARWLAGRSRGPSWRAPCWRGSSSRTPPGGRWRSSARTSRTPTTIRLSELENLAAELADAPILIVATARPDLLVRRPGWSHAGGNHSRIDLQPLTRMELELLIASRLGAGGPRPGGPGGAGGERLGRQPAARERGPARLSGARDPGGRRMTAGASTERARRDSTQPRRARRWRTRASPC